jgi:hypothetical protein
MECDDGSNFGWEPSARSNQYRLINPYAESEIIERIAWFVGVSCYPAERKITFFEYPQWSSYGRELELGTKLKFSLLIY